MCVIAKSVDSIPEDPPLKEGDLEKKKEAPTGYARGQMRKTAGRASAAEKSSRLSQGNGKMTEKSTAA